MSIDARQRAAMEQDQAIYDKDGLRKPLPKRLPKPLGLAERPTARPTSP